MTPSTVRELLNWSYANLAMAHAAVADNSTKYGRKHFIIRARLFSGLTKGTMNIGSLVDDEKAKYLAARCCSYCGSGGALSADHLIPTHRGGPDTADNIVWACRSCNSSKGAKDYLAWAKSRGEFPPLLLLRRYLKLAYEVARNNGLLDIQLAETSHMSIDLSSIPVKYPAPYMLRLWVSESGANA